MDTLEKISNQAVVGDKAVVCQDLVVCYGANKPVLENLSCEVQRRGLTHLVGANGTGKSTLIEVISGYLRPTAGLITVLGAPPDAVRHRRRICRSQTALFPRSTAREHLELACIAAGDEIGPVLQRAERYGVSRWLDAPADELSTGNKRKLWILLCSVGTFDLIALDEPFNGLDRDAAHVVAEELKGWAQNGAVLLVAHDPPDDLTPDHQLALQPVW